MKIIHEIYKLFLTIFHKKNVTLRCKMSNTDTVSAKKNHKQYEKHHQKHGFTKSKVYFTGGG